MKGRHLLTVLQDLTCDIVRGATKGSTFEKRRRRWQECSNGIRGRGIKQKLLLGGKRTLNDTLRQTLELEVAKLVVGCSIRLRKTTGQWGDAGLLPDGRRNGKTSIGYSGLVALRIWQCDMTLAPRIMKPEEIVHCR
jgi:hypothetical protein